MPYFVNLSLYLGISSPDEHFVNFVIRGKYDGNSHTWFELDTYERCMCDDVILR